MSSMYFQRCQTFRQHMKQIQLKRYKSSTITIDGISHETNSKSEWKHLIPIGYWNRYAVGGNIPQSLLRDLKWMIQKDKLEQDMFLVGPVTPRKRHLPFIYSELFNREIEYICTTRDTSESDLKQRREMKERNVKFIDQIVVEAVKNGRLLVIDAVENAERNVLPIINNLLENREMQLEDGSLLINENKYRNLLEKYGKEDINVSKLIPIHSNFRCIVLGTPYGVNSVERSIIPFKFGINGKSIDPPFRSRFQGKFLQNDEDFNYSISTNFIEETVKEKNEKQMKLVKQFSNDLTSVAFAINNGSKSDDLGIIKERHKLYFPENLIKPAIEIYGRLLDKCEDKKENLRDFIFNSIYPINLLQTKDDKISETLSLIVKEYNLSFNPTNIKSKIPHKKLVDSQEKTLFQLNGIFESGSDICLIGERGSGKTFLVETFLKDLKQIDNHEIIPLYQDLTLNELMINRITNEENGNTEWKISQLLQAMIDGKVTILDGIHRLHPHTLFALQRLVQDREYQLPNGDRILSAKSFDHFFNNKQENIIDKIFDGKRHIYRCHEQFRIIAISENGTKQQNWLNNDTVSMGWINLKLDELKETEFREILLNNDGKNKEIIDKLLSIRKELEDSTNNHLRQLTYSLRQMLNIQENLASFSINNDVANSLIHFVVKNSMLHRFLPTVTRNNFNNLLNRIIPIEKDFHFDEMFQKNRKNGKKVEKTNKSRENLGKIPNIVFHENRRHRQLLELMKSDLRNGNHICLIGNQGVGKNKLADKLLQELELPREYIQLHRDTTIHSLSSQISIIDGKINIIDSPLITAIKNGLILLIDEADKASLHVTVVLRSLFDSGQMRLSDGRLLKKHVPNHLEGNENVIKIHKDFRCIVLANRPGFPFLGNDFYSQMGDLFNCYAIDNPDFESEYELVQQYGKHVPEEIVKKLILSFNSLRELVNNDELKYPYSTRELTAVIKHLNEFYYKNSNDKEMEMAAIYEALNNVFDFDVHNTSIYEIIAKKFEENGIEFPSYDQLSSWNKMKNMKNNLNISVRLNEENSLERNRLDRLFGELGGPKHGKVDPNNEPHVGGNTWAGGSGGRDTAGLGGVGGPYRLDGGHDIHQVSDEIKQNVPEEILKKAREMNREVFKKKLEEIKMSEYDASTYTSYRNAVNHEVELLRNALDNLKSRRNERQWIRGKSTGSEMDETKIVEAMLGEKNIYKRRELIKPEDGIPKIRPKLISLLVDVSGSMYRFARYDGRLQLELEAALMLIEMAEGRDDIVYEIIGHSGEDDAIEFVKVHYPPKNAKQKIDILKMMIAHSQFCFAGDNTVSCLKNKQENIKKLLEAKDDKFDEAFIIILSDANFRRYGINVDNFGELLSTYKHKDEVNLSSYAIFIGSLGDEANHLKQKLPSDRAFVCRTTSELPVNISRILEQSFDN
ncbi:hypothetical protein SNEBB_005189 [Seison nebaliae]|nr:hypothetical protein SNEBB_005189 [Seison nebaliae]